jgi:hypothetical protein
MRFEMHAPEGADFRAQGIILRGIVPRGIVNGARLYAPGPSLDRRRFARPSCDSVFGRPRTAAEHISPN